MLSMQLHTPRTAELSSSLRGWWLPSAILHPRIPEDVPAAEIRPKARSSAATGREFI